MNILPCENDIYHIPIINETESGMTLKNWGSCKKVFEKLKREDGMHFNYYDMDMPAQSRMYFEKLKQYQINYKEWETIIKKINLKESGLSELFTDCRDEKGLVEKWFLEAIESKLNKDGNRILEFETIIKKYAKQYRDNQTKIQRMKNLRGFLEESSGIRVYADEYVDYTEKRKNKENDIAWFNVILNELNAEAEERKRLLDEDIRKKQIEISDIKYEEVSYNIHSLEAKKERLIHEYEHLKKVRLQKKKTGLRIRGQSFFVREKMKKKMLLLQNVERLRAVLKHQKRVRNRKNLKDRNLEKHFLNITAGQFRSVRLKSQIQEKI